MQTLVLQQQEQIRKLQEHACYDQLRQASSPSKLASSNDPNNVKTHNSSVYVSTFNPPCDNDSSPIIVTPKSENSFHKESSFILPTTPNSDAIMSKAALLPVLGTQPESPSDESIPSAAGPGVIDLTDETSHEPSEKRHKRITVEVTVIVKMPGHVHPTVETMQSMVESTGSDDENEN